MRRRVRQDARADGRQPRRRLQVLDLVVPAHADGMLRRRKCSSHRLRAEGAALLHAQLVAMRSAVQRLRTGATAFRHSTQ